MPDSNPLPDLDSHWVQAFRLIREEVKHEQSVLANRLSSYIVSQSFLISAYAVGMNHQSDVWGISFRFYFTIILCAVGFLLSLRAQPGILDASDIIRRWHEKQDQLLSEHSELEVYEALRNKEMNEVRRRDQMFAQASAYIFAAAWVLLAVLAVLLYVRNGH